MNTLGIHHGTVRKYRGIIFKQWKKKYLVLTAEGCLLLCPDAASPPDQMVVLKTSCEAIVEGRDILDLPRLPSDGKRDCCFALMLVQEKYLLLLADTAEDCSQWLYMLNKVRESLASPLHSCKRHSVPAPLMNVRELIQSDQSPDKSPLTPSLSDAETSSPIPSRDGSLREKGRKSPRTPRHKGRPPGCLRHGTANNAQSVRAVYLLMGGAAASTAMGYLAGSHANAEANVPDLPGAADFSGVGPDGVCHSYRHALDSPHFFDFEGADSGFDAFDCGEFSF